MAFLSLIIIIIITQLSLLGKLTVNYCNLLQLTRATSSGLSLYSPTETRRKSVIS
jgi:hypothetical protein